MGGRYLVTGVQLGILKAMANSIPKEPATESIKLINEILEKQFVADSDQPVQEDVERIYLETP